MSTKTFSVLSLFIFLFMIASAQDNTKQYHDEAIRFIQESIDDFKKADPSGNVPAEIKDEANWFEMDMATCEKQKYFPEMTQNITDLYQQRGKKISVKFETKNEGAIIKYQTIFKQDIKKIAPLQASNPTNICLENLSPGIYYVWSERNGKPTSDVRRKVFVHTYTPLVTIDEVP